MGQKTRYFEETYENEQIRDLGNGEPWAKPADFAHSFPPRLTVSLSRVLRPLPSIEQKTGWPNGKAPYW